MEVVFEFESHTSQTNPKGKKRKRNMIQAQIVKSVN